MERLFLTVVQMGISFSGLLLAAAGLRLVLKKAPKNMICLLWMVVGIRLLCPFNIVTDFGLLPGSDVILEKYEVWKAPADADLQPQLSEAQQTELSNVPSGSKEAQADTPATTSLTKKASVSWVLTAAAWIWFAGVLGMCVYLAVGWWAVKSSIAQAVPSEWDGIRFYQCGQISSPFLFGLAPARIYVPFSVSGQELSFVLKHELAHKKHGDHITKLIGYLIVAIYWFQPLVWGAYVLFCRDIEMARDESVVWELGESCKKSYSKALLTCSVNHSSVSAFPVAFGEIGVRDRVKKILDYQRPKLRIVLTAAVLCAAVTLGFATEARSKDADKKVQAEALAEYNASEKIVECVETWARAFCARDVKTVLKMLDTSGRSSLEKQAILEGEHSFGWSSPWPWEPEVVDDGENFRIVSADAQTAEILYYAWTSDPHITVWHQVITYQYAEEEGLLQISGTSNEVLDNIHTAKQFDAAYPNGEIDGTRMDYWHGNGVGESLEQQSPRSLARPDTAAAYLLNIQTDTDEVRTKTSKEDGDTVVTFYFSQDGGSASVKMVQPYGENGIWVVQTYAEN